MSKNFLNKYLIFKSIIILGIALFVASTLTGLAINQIHFPLNENDFKDSLQDINSIEVHTNFRPLCKKILNHAATDDGRCLTSKYNCSYGGSYSPKSDLIYHFPKNRTYPGFTNPWANDTYSCPSGFERIKEGIVPLFFQTVSKTIYGPIFDSQPFYEYAEVYGCYKCQ